MKSINSELNLLKSIMKLIAKEFGDKCEVVLHDWSSGYDQTIVVIENGHVSDRKVGDCGTNLGLEILGGSGNFENQFNYLNKTRSGKTLRSSTIYLENDNGEKIGALCINYDITELLAAANTLVGLTANEQNEQEEYLVNDVSELLEHLLNNCIRMIGKTPKDMDKDEKKRALKYLDEKGAFLITKSGNRVCEFFEISKYTLYNYLDEFRRK